MDFKVLTLMLMININFVLSFQPQLGRFSTPEEQITYEMYKAFKEKRPICANQGFCIVGQCHYINPSIARCQCQPTFTGTACNRYIGRCKGRTCYPHLCADDNSKTDGYRCVCRPGYENVEDSNDPKCYDIDECANDVGICDASETCQNINGGYRCVKNKKRRFKTDLSRHSLNVPFVVVPINDPTVLDAKLKDLLMLKNARIDNSLEDVKKVESITLDSDKLFNSDRNQQYLPKPILRGWSDRYAELSEFNEKFSSTETVKDVRNVIDYEYSEFSQISSAHKIYTKTNIIIITITLIAVRLRTTYVYFCATMTIH